MEIVLEGSDYKDLGWGQRICISRKFPGNAYVGLGVVQIYHKYLEEVVLGSIARGQGAGITLENGEV